MHYLAGAVVYHSQIAEPACQGIARNCDNAAGLEINGFKRGFVHGIDLLSKDLGA
jgi:hypothetical protein